MTADPNSTSPVQPDRRRFLKTTSAVATVGVVSTAFTTPMVHAAGSDVIKYALIGCGGRGTGAAIDAATADKNAKLSVLADIFPDRLDYAKNALKNRLGMQSDISDDRCFSGFDAYKKVMESDVDLVLLCSTPHFRPIHLRAAVEAGKHVFCEKPVAVDGPGVRSVLESAEIAKQKKLSLVSGLCWRYDLGVRETMKRIKDGAIGDIVSIQENYLTGGLWHRGKKPEWSQMEYEIRNWLYFTWLSGDHNTEQHIHSLDKAMWLMNDEPPVACYGLGGRQVRTDEQWGNIYDHFAVVYEWANGVRCHAYTRQQGNCFNETEDFVVGTKGRAQILRNTVEGAEKWKYNGPSPSMYLVEHQELSKSIREGAAINNGTYMSYSTLLAIMGRMACYTGARVTWDHALNSPESLTPAEYAWGDVKLPSQLTSVAKPGVTKLAVVEKPKPAPPADAPKS